MTTRVVSGKYVLGDARRRAGPAGGPLRLRRRLDASRPSRRDAPAPGPGSDPLRARPRHTRLRQPARALHPRRAVPRHAGRPRDGAVRPEARLQHPAAAHRARGEGAHRRGAARGDRARHVRPAEGRHDHPARHVAPRPGGVLRRRARAGPAHRRRAVHHVGVELAPRRRRLSGVGFRQRRPRAAPEIHRAVQGARRRARRPRPGRRSARTRPTPACPSCCAIAARRRTTWAASSRPTSRRHHRRFLF